MQAGCMKMYEWDCMNSGNHKVVTKRYCSGYSLNWDMSPGKIRIIFFQVLCTFSDSKYISVRSLFICAYLCDPRKANIPKTHLISQTTKSDFKAPCFISKIHTVSAVPLSSFQLFALSVDAKSAENPLIINKKEILPESIDPLRPRQIKMKSGVHKIMASWEKSSWNEGKSEQNLLCFTSQNSTIVIVLQQHTASMYLTEA